MKSSLESVIETEIREHLNRAHVRVMKHEILPCWNCRAKPRPTTGLGTHASDLHLVVPPYGRYVAMEVKRPETRNAKRDEMQREWMKWIRYHNGVAGVVTNVDEAFSLIEIARRLPG